MDQPLDFSFHKGDPFAVPDELESPTPMPKSPTLPVTTNASANQPDYPHMHEEVIAADERVASSPSVSKMAVEGMEALRISPSALRASPPKPKPRVKVPFEKGYSQMDWLKLTRTASDLAGLKGCTSKRLILMDEVRQHQTKDDAWTVLRGRVYNISPYLRFHPGGVDMLMKGAGKDCISLFNKYHSWVNAEFLLEKCLVGYLDVEQQRELSQQ